MVLLSPDGGRWEGGREREKEKRGERGEIL